MRNVYELEQVFAAGFMSDIYSVTCWLLDVGLRDSSRESWNFDMDCWTQFFFGYNCGTIETIPHVS